MQNDGWFLYESAPSYSKKHAERSFCIPPAMRTPLTSKKGAWEGTVHMVCTVTVHVHPSTPGIHQNLCCFNKNTKHNPDDYYSSNKMSSSRHFITPSLQKIEFDTKKEHEYMSIATSLAEKCWAYHDHRTDASDSIYTGRLGACAFLRLRLALHFTAKAANPLTQASDKQVSRQHSEQLLADGLKETQKVLSKMHGSSTYSRRYTLLESPLVGALALQAVFLYLMGHSEEAERSASHLLSIGNTIRDNLDQDECEVLYGRCGYLLAILFIRKYLSRPDFGRDVAVSIIDQIISNGVKTASQLNHHLPLAWMWHRKLYLGACHGVSGIIFTLLHFLPELDILTEQKEMNLLDLLKDTLQKLNESQYHASGTSFGSMRCVDCQECYPQMTSMFLPHFCFLVAAIIFFTDIF